MSNAPHPLLMNEAVLNGPQIDEFLNGSQMNKFSYHFLVFLAYYVNKQYIHVLIFKVYSAKCIGIEIQCIA